MGNLRTFHDFVCQVIDHNTKRPNGHIGEWLLLRPMPNFRLVPALPLWLCFVTIERRDKKRLTGLLSMMELRDTILQLHVRTLHQTHIIEIPLIEIHTIAITNRRELHIAVDTMLPKTKGEIRESTFPSAIPSIRCQPDHLKPPRQKQSYDCIRVVAFSYLYRTSCVLVRICTQVVPRLSAISLPSES